MCYQKLYVMAYFAHVEIMNDPKQNAHSYSSYGCSAHGCGCSAHGCLETLTELLNDTVNNSESPDEPELVDVMATFKKDDLDKSKTIDLLVFYQQL